MTEADSELVQRSVRGDLAAFEKLVLRYERSVRSVARAFLADRHTCEDVTQETFVAAHRALEALREPDRFGPWLMQIARRTASRVREQDARRPVPVEDIERASRESPRSSRNDDLLSLIERLPAHERLVITMHYFDGHSSREVADATGVPLGTVTKRLSRAYERLRQWLSVAQETKYE